MHQTNGRFVYIGLNADCRVKFLSDNNETTYGAACVFHCINQLNQDKHLQQIQWDYANVFE